MLVWQSCSERFACIHDRYEGEWSEGKREGQGKCKYAHGDVYDGAWASDVRAGMGTCAYANDDRYTGAPCFGAPHLTITGGCRRHYGAKTCLARRAPACSLPSAS